MKNYQLPKPISRFYIHISFFLILLTASLFILYLAIWVSFSSRLYLSFSLLSCSPTLSVDFFLDSFSSWFLFVVLLISSIIILYSFFYMAPYNKAYIFLSLTCLFVASICLVVSISSLFFVILGWDGLGLVSFFLIVYYQNQSSIFSGIFTLLINRFGDGLFLCSIALYLFFIQDLSMFQSSLPSSPLLLFFLIFTFITKRAIFPFSPWLPMAIAAPTPISALVHSSTLVTSGLFLMIKFSYLLYSSYMLIFILTIFSLFTSFYAGMNTIFEKDLKKIIALSTLSHLGFIGLSFSLGLLSLSFFHLLTHALFKSLLFISIGDIIINLGHRQDIRYLSSGFLYTPFSSLIISVSLLNLFGIPALSGFFSKDLILETCNFSDFRVVLYFILYANLIFTFYYTYQLFYYSFSFSKYSPLSLFNSPILLHSVLIGFLALVSLFFGFFYLRRISAFICFLPVPLAVKFVPLSLFFIFGLGLFIFLRLFRSLNQTINLYFSSIIFLFYFMTKISSLFYYSFSFSFSKTLEQGILNSLINIKSSSLLFYLSSSFLSHSFIPSSLLVILSFFFYGNFILFFVYLGPVKSSRRY